MTSFRSNPENMTRLAVALCVAAVVMLTITAHTLAFQDEVIMEQMRAEAAEARAKQYEDNSQLAEHLNALVAACMDGKRLVWTDPHTKVDMAAFCDVVPIGRIQ